jgi:hypothetical protein
MGQSAFNTWRQRAARVKPGIRHIGRRALSMAPSGVRGVLLHALTWARGLRRTGFFFARTEPTLQPRETIAHRARPRSSSLEWTGSQATRLSFQMPDTDEAGSAADFRQQALDFLLAAGTLKACAAHGSHFLGTGDLAAAHKLAAETISSSRDPALIFDGPAIRQAISPVYEEASRYYRCESCFSELRARLTAC